MKPLEELTLMDDYMFAAVMSDKENLRPLIETILGIEVGELTRRLDGAVGRVKASEERRHEYMVTMIRDMEIREEGREQGIEQGIERERLEGVRNVMGSLGVGAEEAMEILKVPEAERRRCLESL